jgi:hypothetical protein
VVSSFLRWRLVGKQCLPHGSVPTQRSDAHTVDHSEQKADLGSL